MKDRLEFADQTLVHPLGLLLFAAMAILLLTVRRRHALLPILLLVCLIPPAQRVTIIGFDFTLLRLLVLVGWARVLATGEQKGLRLVAIDRVIIAFATVSALANIVLHGTAGSVIYNLGIAFDVLSIYFLARVLVRSFEDVDATAGWIVWLAILLSVPFLLERYVEPHRNVFAVFGGIDEITSAREGKVRAQGAFPHAIIAGCFWASLLPLLIARYRARPELRAWTALGFLAAVLIIISTASSTPLAGAMAACGATMFYRYRRQLPIVRWSAAITLIALQLAMSAPVWHLVSRIDLVGGSTGWHRFHLIDEAIRHFPEWAFLGTRSTEAWGQGLGDVTNQYVMEGVRGGALALALFLAAIVLAFRGIGRVVRAKEGDFPRQMYAWALGASVFTHAGMFIAVSYFGQMPALWYMTLAAIASLEVRAQMRPAAARPLPSLASGLSRLPAEC